VQLAYSCTHLFSDTGHLLSTASLYGGRVGGERSDELRAVCTSSTDVTREVRPVRRLLVICCWFLVPVGRDV